MGRVTLFCGKILSQTDISAGRDISPQKGISCHSKIFISTIRYFLAQWEEKKLSQEEISFTGKFLCHSESFLREEIVWPKTFLLIENQ